MPRFRLEFTYYDQRGGDWQLDADILDIDAKDDVEAGKKLRDHGKKKGWRTVDIEGIDELAD